MDVKIFKLFLIHSMAGNQLDLRLIICLSLPSGIWNFSLLHPTLQVTFYLKRVLITSIQKKLPNELHLWSPKPRSSPSSLTPQTGHTLGIRYEAVKNTVKSIWS